MCLPLLFCVVWIYSDVFVICLVLIVIVVVGLLLVFLFVLVSFVAVVCWLLCGEGGFRVLIGCFLWLADGCCASFLCVLRVFCCMIVFFCVSGVRCCCLLWTFVA